MVSRVSTVAFQGIDAVPVDVQVMVAPGKMGMHIVGLLDKAVAESRERVQAALHASGLSMPPKKVTINLAPADLPKEGSHFDLPIALGLMAALGAIPSDALSDYAVLGELSLDGTITPVAGVLPAAIAANGVGKGLICPHECGPEAAWADSEMSILAPVSLIGLANHFRGTQVLYRPKAVTRIASAALPNGWRARLRQMRRYEQLGVEGVGVNAHCPTALIEQVVDADESAMQLIADAADKMKFSARGYHRILKVARTIADLDDVDRVGRIHIAEAISYRIAGEQLSAAA